MEIGQDPEYTIPFKYGVNHISRGRKEFGALISIGDLCTEYGDSIYPDEIYIESNAFCQPLSASFTPKLDRSLIQKLYPLSTPN